jgi:small subunit ribosomal protein S9
MVEKKETNKKNAENISDTEAPAKTLKKGFISGTGRRKTAVARVFLWETKGDFIVNDMKFDEYFPSEIEKIKWEKPFHAIGVSHPEAKFSASIKVEGSGKSSQLDAVVLGISRALSKIDEEFDRSLRKQGFLTRDSRMVERKKPYLRKARKRPQYSKR